MELNGTIIGRKANARNGETEASAVVKDATMQTAWENSSASGGTLELEAELVPTAQLMTHPLVNATVTGCLQPTAETILILLSNPETEDSCWLLSVHEAAPRFLRSYEHGGRTGSRRGLGRKASRPGPFCQYLQARLVGGRTALPRLFGKQTLGLPVFSKRGNYWVVLEANGPHSNLLLLDQARCLLLGLRHPSLPRRRLVAGDLYRPPATVTWLPKDCPIESWRLGCDLDQGRSLEHLCREREDRWEFDQLQCQARKALHQRIKRISRRIAGLRKDLQQANEAEQYRRWGELLKIHAHEVPPGVSEVALPDDFAPEKSLVRIRLNSQMELAGNLDRLFTRYRKLRKARPVIAERLRTSDMELERCQQFLTAVEGTATSQALAQLLDAAEIQLPRSLLPVALPNGATNTAKSEVASILERVSAQGFRILVGRTAEANDRVTFRLAAGRDWWLHAQGVTGAHVVVKCPTGEIPPPQTLREAAWLAAYYSALRHDGQVDVDLTQRKYVRKVKGGSAGLVAYTQNKTLLVKIDDLEAAKVLDQSRRKRRGMCQR